MLFRSYTELLLEKGLWGIEMSKHRDRAVAPPFSRPPIKMEVMVAWLFLASLWVIILVSWFLFGMGSGEDYLAQLSRTIITA